MSLRKNQSGRVSFVAIVAVLAAALVVGLFIFSKESLDSIGSRFMDALARGDVDRLTKMTVLGKSTPEQVRKEWEFATQVPGKHYLFAWKVARSSQNGDNDGAVTVMVSRNIASGGSYEEKFELPMHKENGEWKVDARGINREMYPALPR